MNDDTTDAQWNHQEESEARRREDDWQDLVTKDLEAYLNWLQDSLRGEIEWHKGE